MPQQTRRQFVGKMGVALGLSTALGGCTNETEKTDDEVSGSLSYPTIGGDTALGELQPTNTSPVRNSVVSNAEEGEQPNVTILEHKMVEGDFGWDIRGKVQNSSGERQNNIRVQAFFYDAQGKMIGDNLWRTSGVPAAEILPFEIAYLSDEGKPKRYKLRADASPFKNASSSSVTATLQNHNVTTGRGGSR